MSSLLKYTEDTALAKGNGRGRASFNRAHVDGMPFRGSQAFLKEEEFEEYTETVNDGYIQVFDLSKSEDSEKLQEIIDKASNGWFKVSRMSEHFVPQPDGGLKVFVYCVWVEPYKELAKHRMPPGMLQQPQRI